MMGENALPTLVDIHCHALFGVDDGASDEATMCEMLRMAYLDGTRTMCFTPHCSFEHMPSAEDVAKAFARAEDYCRAQLPEMKLFLGDELTYRFGSAGLLAEKKCRTIADSRYVLVDFFMVPDAASILRGIDHLQNAGYLPIVAHAERYECIRGGIKDMAKLVETGALIQVNASSLFASPFSRKRRMARRLLAEGWVDVVASDGHDAQIRTPLLGRAYKMVRSKYGEAYADRLFSENPKLILRGERIVTNR